MVLASYSGVPTIAIKLVGILALFFISVMQAWSSKAGTRAQLVLTVFKVRIVAFALPILSLFSTAVSDSELIASSAPQVFALLLVFIGGLVFLGLEGGASSFSFEGSSDKAAGYALALFSALWVSLSEGGAEGVRNASRADPLSRDCLQQTFDGWDQCNYVAKDCAPGTLPSVLVLSPPHPIPFRSLTLSALAESSSTPPSPWS